MKPDKLNREEFIKLVIDIILNQSRLEKGYSIAIDGIWGSGKSYILEALTERLELIESDKPFLVFRYNCWENDFYEEPLIALATILVENLKIQEDPDTKDIVSTCTNTIIQTASLLIEMKTGINPAEYLNALKEHTGSIFSLFKSSPKIENFNNQKSLQDAVLQLRNVLLELSKTYRLVLLVDELDRCLPEYAVKVLERLHHICYQSKIINIIAMDKVQLADGISKIFGKKYNSIGNHQSYSVPFADHYLQKFIDISIPLSNGTLDNNKPLVCDILDIYSEFIRNDMQGLSLIKLDKDFIITFYNALFTNVDIRTQEKVINQVKLCHELTIQSGISIEKYDYQILIYELLTSISYFLFKRKKNCTLKIIQGMNCVLEFFDSNSNVTTEYEKKYSELNKNLSKIFNITLRSYDVNNVLKNYIIDDNKSFLITYFSDSNIRITDPLQNTLRKIVEEDKKFLKEYERIIKQLCI